MSDHLIRVEEVTKSYGPVIAVNKVSLAVSAGEIYALLGANGAGKSTLIRNIVGITRPDTGRVIICGEDTRHGASAKRHTGYLPEELTLYERLNGREYLELVAGLKGVSEPLSERELAFFELGGVAGKWVGGYSLGMRKKLGLAAAFLGAPQVLVLDEPLNGLDVEMMRKLRERIRTEKKRGAAILISSHLMEFVERTADRVGIMSGGRLTAEGSPGQLREQTGLASGPFEDVFFALSE